MALIPFVFDNFNDNSIDTANRWVITSGSTLQTEASAKLNMPVAASAAPTAMYTKGNFYDLTKGRLGIRYAHTGTADPSIYTYWGLRDSSGNALTFFARSNDYTMQLATNNAGTGTWTQTDTTIGMGPSWTANTYVGWTYTDATKTYSLGKSTDGVTWTEIAKYVMTAVGALSPHQCGLYLGCTSYGTLTNYAVQWDDLTYFATDTQLRHKVRAAAAWSTLYPRVRVAGAWVRPIVKVRVGNTWARPQ